MDGVARNAEDRALVVNWKFQFLSAIGAVLSQVLDTKYVMATE
jgi:hypothetical protein